MSIEKIVSVARGEVGTREKRSGGHWVNDSKYTRWLGLIPGYGQGGYGYLWCAALVAWCADKAGMASLYPKSASCAGGVAWFRKRGRFSPYRAVRAQGFVGARRGAHTGIVDGCAGDNITTVEGNTNTSGSAEGDGVYVKVRRRRDAYVYGYGYPDVAGGVSADPNAAKFGYEHSATGSVKAAKPKPKPKPKYEPFPGAAWFKRNPNSPIVTAMGKRLVAVGCSAYRVGPGRQWTEADRLSYQKWQLKLYPGDR